MKILLRVICVFLMSLSAAAAVNAQTTTFSFPGNLPKHITPATDSFEMEFRLMNAPTGGTQVGPTNAIASVAVRSHAFSVWLDFGSAAFPGADRFIEISVRRSGSELPFIVIEPRTPVLSVPYAIRALKATTADNSLAVGGVSVENLVMTTDTRLSDSRDPNPGSNNYIQNTTTQQAGANFNISGNGTAGGTLSANVVNAGSQYELGSGRILSAGGNSNTFVGLGTGLSNTVGNQNVFLGTNAGSSNTEGDANSIIGSNAGLANTTGDSNSFFGTNTGRDNTTGGQNVFLGSGAGRRNTTGSGNAFVGHSAGAQNTQGGSNSFFGLSAGSKSQGTSNALFGTLAGSDLTSGNNNAFFGAGTGFVTETGTGNTYIGTFAAGSDAIDNSTAIGFRSFVTQSNSIVIGGITGFNGGTDTNVGIGTTAPGDRLHVNGMIRVSALGAAGTTQLCRNALNQISTCASPRDAGGQDRVFGQPDALYLDTIKDLRSRIEVQQAQINALKQFVCSQQPTAGFCQ